MITEAMASSSRNWPATGLKLRKYGDVDDPGHGCAERRQHERDEAHTVRVDAGISSGADVTASGADLQPEWRTGKHDAGDEGHENIHIVCTLTTSATVRMIPGGNATPK